MSSGSDRFFIERRWKNDSQVNCSNGQRTLPKNRRFGFAWFFEGRYLWFV